jgi:hypothetical protein
MRKHPLIALTAFTALTASAIAGASTGTFDSSTMLTSSRTTHRPSQPPARAATKFVVFDANTPYRIPPYSRDLVVIHDRARPEGIQLSSATGLPVVHKAKPKPKPKPIPVVAPAPIVQVAPTPPPVTTTTTPPPPVAPAGGVWYELRMCESGGNYAEDSGNGYYGAYQFALSTWYGLGFTGLPSDASSATQDAAAQELQARSGWGQWPACSAELGL